MAGTIEVRLERLGALYVDGLELPYVEFERAEPTMKLIYEGQEYWYQRTVPLRGYGAILGRHIRELEAEGKKLFLARFGTRIYIYATGVTPLGSGKAPGD